MWNNKAKGVYTDIDEPITVEDLQGQDFLVSHTGITFTDNIQIAHDYGIPFFAFESTDAWEVSDKLRLKPG